MYRVYLYARMYRCANCANYVDGIDNMRQTKCANTDKFCLIIASGVSNISLINISECL